MPVNTADVAPTGTSTTGDSGTVDTTNPVTPDVDPGVQDTATFNPCTDADTAAPATDGAAATAIAPAGRIGTTPAEAFCPTVIDTAMAATTPTTQQARKERNS